MSGVGSSGSAKRGRPSAQKPNKGRAPYLPGRQCLNTPSKDTRCPEYCRSPFCHSQKCNRDWARLPGDIQEIILEASSDADCDDDTWAKMYDMLTEYRDTVGCNKSQSYIGKMEAKISNQKTGSITNALAKMTSD